MLGVTWDPSWGSDLHRAFPWLRGFLTTWWLVSKGMSQETGKKKLYYLF